MNNFNHVYGEMCQNSHFPTTEMDNAQQAGRGEGVEWRGQEWSGGDGSGVEWRGGEGREGEGRAGCPTA